MIYGMMLQNINKYNQDERSENGRKYTGLLRQWKRKDHSGSWTWHSDTLDFLKKLEPELQIFRFEKAACGYSDLSPKEKQEQMLNIKNALGYSRKVLDTGQCDLLILDEIFGLVDYNIITIEELMDLIAVKKDSMDLILTGRNLPDEVREIADCVYSIQREKEKTPEILAQGNF